MEVNLDSILERLEKISRTSPSLGTIRLDIPLRVPPKARPKMTQRGGKRWWFTPSSSSEEEIGLYASKLMRENGWKPFGGRVKLSATIYITGRRRADLSNYLKSIEDALEGVCYYNDIQISEYGKVRVVDKARENKLIVELTDLGKIERNRRKK